MSFRKDFAWGEATSSYQIEGGAFIDGKGWDIWDVYCKEEGKVFEGHTGDVACDHYHRFKEDVALMKELGINAYRFSINWSRIFPNGYGKVNELGVKFYHNLIDELINAGIEPFITLYHWELPYELHKKGGWMNDEIVNWFADYAAFIVKEFSDKVTKYFTFNEPQCFIGLGYVSGIHAPGLKAPIRDTFIMSHNVLKAHGLAVKKMRDAAKQDIQIGIAPTGSMSYPDSNKPEDIEAARMHLMNINTPLDSWTWNVTWWSDPIFFGEYPEDGLKRFKDYLPEITKEDLKLINQPTDFYGQNIYNGNRVKMGADGKPEVVKRYDGFPKTALGWPVTPESLYWGPYFLYERYKEPIYITENGLSCHDVISSDGKVHDPNRIAFVESYLKQLKKASADGVDIRGYFHWSLMDNFEWHSGYADRFGMIYVDYQTQKRIIKDSGYWYKNIIAQNGENL
mgnify:FL=1